MIAANPIVTARNSDDNYLTAGKGIKSWVFTLDHKRIGVMYLVGIVLSFFLGGIMALLVRAELFTPGKLFLTEDKYNEIFTLHGAIMTFLFLIPSIPAVLGNFFLPMMLGAKDVAFPRMNLVSFHLWVFGAIFFLAALLFNELVSRDSFRSPPAATVVAN